MAARRRLTRLSQTADEDPGGGLLGAHQTKIWWGTANTVQGETAGAVSRETDAEKVICQAAGTGETGPRRSVGVGKWGQHQDGTQVRSRQGAALFAGAVALSGGR